MTGVETDGVVDTGEMVVQPNIGVPEHIHDGNDEAFYVPGGHLRLIVAGQNHTLEPGAFAFVPQGVRHHWMNSGYRATRILLTFTPGGMDRYFVEMDRLLRGSRDLKKILPVCVIDPRLQTRPVETVLSDQSVDHSCASLRPVRIRVFA